MANYSRFKDLVSAIIRRDRNAVSAVNGQSDIVVVYLSRGRDGGLDGARAYFESYRKHRAGVEHDFVVLAKGWEGLAGLEEVKKWTGELNGAVVELPDDGFDFGAYFRVAPRLKQEWLFFLNTHSRILADDWLKIMVTAAARDAQIGAVGASGSWESAFKNVSELEVKKGATARVRYLARFVYNYCCFPGYPNPHLRSNAILIRRNLFTRFASLRAVPRHKRDAQQLESGRKGLSRFVLKQGRTLVVCGMDGGVFNESQWKSSRTFRSNLQSNLLVEDNQTRMFDFASAEVRNQLADAAWGSGD